MQCVTSVKYGILVNGQPSHVFKPTKGLRQDDPTSPYLFHQVQGTFSRMLSKALDAGNLYGLRLKEHI